MQGGEEDVLDMEVIYKEYADAVFRFLVTLCRDGGTAEELTQETFYQAVRSSDRYDGTCKVSTWLCQIAKHLWYQELERRKRKGTVVLEEEVVSEGSVLEETVCQKEEKMDLFKKVHILDEVSKEVILLRVTGAFSFREIGEIFGKNENWARVTFYRAKQKITKGSERL